MEEIGYDLVKIVLELFGVYTMWRYMNLFFERPRVSKQILLMAYGFRWLFMCVTDIVVSYPGWNLIFSLISIWLIATCYSKNQRKNISVVLKVYLFIFLAECLVATQDQMTVFQPFDKMQQVTIWNMILIHLFSWTGTLILRKFHHLKQPMQIPTAFVVAVMVIFAALLLLENMLVREIQNKKTTWFLSVLCVSGVAFVLIYLYDTLAVVFQEKKRRELIGQEKVYYQAQAEILQQSEQKQRKARHDRKNHVLVISQLLQEKKYEEAQKYLIQYEESQRQTEPECTTGNLVVDSLVNYKLEIAKENQIEYALQVSLPKTLPIAEDDMVTVLGNLLDNAIEAVERLTENRRMEISMKYEKGLFSLLVKNTYDGIVSLQGDQIRTRKGETEMHGWGLKSVEDVVSKYHGTLRVKYDAMQFCVKITMYGRKMKE